MACVARSSLHAGGQALTGLQHSCSRDSHRSNPVSAIWTADGSFRRKSPAKARSGPPIKSRADAEEGYDGTPRDDGRSRVAQCCRRPVLSSALSPWSKLSDVFQRNPAWPGHLKCLKRRHHNAPQSGCICAGSHHRTACSCNRPHRLLAPVYGCARRETL